MKANSLELKTTVWGKAKLNEDNKEEAEEWTENDFEEENKEMYYELFIKNGEENYDTYWMSSRCVQAYSTTAIFGVRSVSSSGVGADLLCTSFASEGPRVCTFRPCITLNSNVQVTSGDGTESSPFEIK